MKGQISHSGRIQNRDRVTSLFFQNSLWRIGEGSAFFDARVETTLTNTGTDWAKVVFDSMITPRYLAVSGARNTNNFAKFDFRISQVTGNVTEILYSASGSAFAGSMQQIASPTPFSDGTGYSNGDIFALTWGATNVSLLRNPVAPGGSRKIIYDLETTVTGPSTTVVGAGCQGSQVSFGDPRNPGTATRGTLKIPVDLASCSAEPVIGRRFNPYVVPGTFTTVPEPASWAMLIGGFGLTGAAMRRRRAAIA